MIPAAIPVTFFTDHSAKLKREEALDPAELAQRIAEMVAPVKARLPWLKLARFGPMRSNNNSLRHDGNVLAITGIEGDYDGEKIGFDEAVEIAEKAGLAAIIYTSPSHTTNKPRWRVLCPTSRELPPAERAWLMARLNGLYRGIFAVESFTLSQSYYFGHLAGSRDHRVEVVDGTCIDLLDELDRVAIGKPNGGTAGGQAANGSGGPLDEGALAQQIVSGENYHVAGVRLVGKWAQKGVPFLDAQHRLEALFDRVFPPDRDQRWRDRNAEIPRIVLDIYGKEAVKRDAAGITEGAAEADADDEGFDAPPKVGSAAIVIDPAAPFKVAKGYVEGNFTHDDKRTLHCHRGGFYSWSGQAYPEITDPNIRSGLYHYLDQCVALKNGTRRPVKPTQAMVSNVLDALRAVAHLNDSVAPPAWLEPGIDLLPGDIVACSNGLLHLPSLTVLPHTAAFFTYNALDFAYDQSAPEPRQWLAFLAQIWPEDPASIDTLQEIFGLALTGDTSHQKAFLMVGPKRSGKGTVARVLTRLVGRDNTVAPTLAGLGTNFGLAPLIGKRMAIISDARLGGRADRADQHAIAERLLSITGEDSITADRKYQPAWTGRFQVRFLILSNELPRLVDASGALVSRFIVLVLTQSFYGKEDHGLTDRLLTEMPGILNWSIAGWQRLHRRGHFQQPKSATEAVQVMEDIGSPISAFVRANCIVEPGRFVEISRLYEVWCGWSKEHGRERAGTAQNFGRDLRAAVPSIKVTQPRDEYDKRHRQYEGIGLR